MAEYSRTEAPRFPCRESSVSEIRRTTVDILCAWGLSGLASDAQLCVSELATNSVIHAEAGMRVGREIRLVVAITELGRLRVEIHDLWKGLPILRHVDADNVHGRGLLLVSEIAADWGWGPRDGVGKATWFELDLPDPRIGSRRVGPQVGVTETDDVDYPYCLDFASPDGKDDRGVVAVPGAGVMYLTTAQAMTLVSRLAPLLGLTLAPPRSERREPTR